MSEIITKTIDQTALVLPNCWVSRSMGSQYPIWNSTGKLVAPSGKSGVLRKHILEIIDGATDVLALCSFLLADSEIETALLNASDRGVRVYMMIASEARLDNSGDDEFTRSCVHQHKEMLKKMGGKVLIHSAPHFHAKFIFSDPKLQTRKGILLTANLTQEAIERNEELGVVLTDDEIQDLSNIFKFGFWELSEHQMMDSERFQSFKPLNAVEYPSEIKKIPTTNAHSHSLKEHCLNVIQRAKKEIVVSSFGWDLGHEVVNQLCQRSRDGIQVRVLARMRESAMPALVALVNAGAQVYGFKWLHAKALWNDSGEALVMSANMQKDGLDQGFETGVVISGARASHCKEILDLWMANAQFQLKASPKLGEVEGKICYYENRKLEECMILPGKDLDLGDVKEGMQPEFPRSSWRKHPVHKLTIRWKVIPNLPKSKTTKGK